MIGNDIPLSSFIITVTRNPHVGNHFLEPLHFRVIHHAPAPLYCERRFFPRGGGRIHVEFSAQKVHSSFGIMGPNKAVDVPPPTALYERIVEENRARASVDFT